MRNGCSLAEIHKRVFYIDGLVQDRSNSSAIEVELLQSCTKPSIYNVLLLILLHHGFSVQKPLGGKSSPLGKIFIHYFLFLAWHKWQF